MKKRVICGVLAFVMGLSLFTGCSNLQKTIEPKWIAQAKEAVPEKFNEETINQFYLAGEVYTFPCRVMDLIDNGWDFKKTDYAKEKLESEKRTTGFYTLENSSAGSIEIGVFNDTEDTINIIDGLVDHIKITGVSESMLPGQIALSHEKFDSIDDICKSLGNLDFSEKEYSFGKYLTYTYENEDGAKVTVEFTCQMVKKSNGDDAFQIVDVTYDIEFFIYMYFSELLDAEVKSVVENDVSYFKGEIDDEEAQAYIDDARLYYSCAFWAMDFEFESLNAEQEAMMLAVLDKAYSKMTVTKNVLDKNSKVLYTFKGIEVDKAIDYAINAADARYEGNLDEKFSSEEYFALYAEELLNAYDELMAMDFTTYEAVDTNEYVYDDLLCYYMGLYLD